MGFHKMLALCTLDSFKDSVDFGYVTTEVRTGEHASAADSVQYDHQILDGDGKETWIADSGATCHTNSSKEKMFVHEPCAGVSVTFANSRTVPIAGFGNLFVSTGGGDD